MRKEKLNFKTMKSRKSMQISHDTSTTWNPFQKSWENHKTNLVSLLGLGWHCWMLQLCTNFSAELYAVHRILPLCLSSTSPSFKSFKLKPSEAKFGISSCRTPVVLKESPKDPYSTADIAQKAGWIPRAINKANRDWNAGLSGPISFRKIIKHVPIPQA